jgi:predicted SAM-dependent methyltransferase
LQLTTRKSSSGLYVQYGCGFNAPKNWRNFDASPTLRFERVPVVSRLYSKNINRFPPNVEYGDIVKGLPLAPESCAALYASHVLEHLSLEDFRAALRNTFDLLQPRGVFRLVVPDLEILARRYLDSSNSDAALAFMKESSLGVENRSRTIGGFFRSWLGNSSHLWMWDLKSLTRELSEVGFVRIRKCSFGDEPIFRDAEDRARFENAVSVQGAKP